MGDTAQAIGSARLRAGLDIAEPEGAVCGSSARTDLCGGAAGNCRSYRDQLSTSWSQRYALSLLRPPRTNAASAPLRPIRIRTRMIFVETKSGNHKVPYAWKAEYGADNVKLGSSNSPLLGFGLPNPSNLSSN